MTLKYAPVTDTDRVDGWISNVLARGSVSDLDLKITTIDCSTLTKLSLGFGIDLTLVAGRVFLPLLKTLILVKVHVCPNEFQTLLQALPSLEELDLDHVVWKGMDVTVSSASLKTLTVKLCFVLKTLSFDTPSLLHFKYSASVASDYPVVNMGNLVDAQIFLLRKFHVKRLGEPDNDDDALRYSNAWKLFHGIRNVTHLSLLLDTLKVLSMCSESMPVFNNLKSLAIESRKSRGWQPMPALLRNCPQLETLVFKGLVHYVKDKRGYACDCIFREDKGLSLKLCPVKVIKIHEFQGTKKEMALIKHFLDYFPCLKEMEVFYAKENNPTQLGNHEVSKRVLEMFQLYNTLSSCNVKLMVGDVLCI